MFGEKAQEVKLEIKYPHVWLINGDQGKINLLVKTLDPQNISTWLFMIFDVCIILYSIMFK
jgi:hypothetical protein